MTVTGYRERAGGARNPGRGTGAVHILCVLAGPSKMLVLDQRPSPAPCHPAAPGPRRGTEDLMSSRLVRTALVAASLVAAAAGAAAFQHYRPLTVAVLQPEDNVSIKVFGLGTVEARLLSRIGFKVAGTLTELHADHGDQVKAGQVLARIEASEQQARTAKARAQLESAAAAVQVAEAALRKATAVVAQRSQINVRRQALLAKQSVSVEAAEEAQLNAGVAQADLLVAQSEIETAKAKRDDARAQLDYEEVLLRQHELKAPFDALVVSRAKELGSVLPSGDALFTLVAPDTVWMLAYIDEARAGGVQLGQPVEIRLRSLPQQTFKGVVTRIGIESDRVNEERRVYVSCTDCPQAFHLGEQAELHIVTAHLPRALLVPEAAIGTFDGAGGTIWTIEDGRLRQRPARFGKRTLDGRYELAETLPPGVAVVGRTTADLRDGRAAKAAPDGAP